MNLTKNQIEIMLKMQTATNTLIDQNWREKKHPYLRGAMIEAVEAIEHHGWKWWKKQEKDLPQLKMELVDIWHFALSDYLTNLGCLTYSVNAEMVKIELERTRDEVHFFSGPSYRISACETTLDKFDLLIAGCALGDFNMSLFLSIMEDVEMTQQDLFNMYIAKNVLNEFRQKNGYKEGFYVKIWNGREDNQHLEEFMNGVDSSEPNYADILRGMLHERYKTVVKSVDECYVTRGN